MAGLWKCLSACKPKICGAGKIHSCKTFILYPLRNTMFSCIRHHLIRVSSSQSTPRVDQPYSHLVYLGTQI